MSPRTHSSSTGPSSPQTASRAARLAWMSDRTARRMGLGVYRWSAERPPGRLSWPAGESRIARALLAHDHEPMSAERGHSRIEDPQVAATEHVDRPAAAPDLSVAVGE